MGESARRSVRDVEERLRVLSDVMRAFADATTDHARLLDVIAVRVSGAVADSCRVLLLSDDGKTVTLGAMAAVNEEVARRTTSLLAEYPFELAAYPAFERMLAGTPLCIPRLAAPEIRERFPASYLDAAEAASIHSMLLVPLRAHGQPVGALILARCLTGAPPFDEQDVELARNLADHAALAISNARSYAREHESADLHRLIFETSPAPMFVFDVETLRFLAVNDAACKLYGYSEEEMLGRGIGDLRLPGDATSDVVSMVRGEGDLTASRQHRRRDGTILDVEGTSRPMLFRGKRARLTVLKDVTEQARHEEQVHHEQKMDAIGVLAGGIAHDFNNVLSVVLSYADLIRTELPEGDPIRKDVEEIRIAAQSAADLTRQLLMFSSRQLIVPKVLDLNLVIGGVDRMVRRILGADVELVSLLAPSLGRVRADPGSIERVIVNLIVNARDAMAVGGKITIQTANVQRANEPYVAVSVTDTGAGMTAATRARIFEPFFTTKERGRGTGLGLSTVFGIVQQSGGTIDVESELGAGSKFTVYLPCVEPTIEERRSNRPPASTSHGSETILLVEDEEQVRAVARSILSVHGYEVLDARDPAEATRICSEHARPIHLLLTDVVLPQMGGPELAKRLTAARPDMKVLFMSGYTDDAVVRHGVLHGQVAFLPKPFTMEDLTVRVREVLDAAEGD